MVGSKTTWPIVAIISAVAGHDGRVGASRLYLGVHWLTDVLGGYALGLAWPAVVILTSLILEDRQRRRPPH